MTLDEWMTRETKTQEEVAKALKCDQAHVSRLRAGKAIGSPTTIQRIVAMTSGAVTFDDMVAANEAYARAAAA
jgi:transcriptional regulator with XRE-family HTH domain